jgi:hypothetical protein
MSEANRLQAKGLWGCSFIFTCTLDGWWGFLWFSLATMMIRKMQIENWVGGVCAAIAHSVILWQSSRFLEFGWGISVIE